MPELSIIDQFTLASEQYIKIEDERKVLLEWEKPQLEAQYTTRLGMQQLDLLSLQLNIKGLKRKLELIRVAINKDGTVDLDKIEDIVAYELEGAMQALTKKLDDISDARNLLDNAGNVEHAVALRKTYRALANLLHPEINPEQTEEEAHMWQDVIKYYENRNLERMQFLEITLEAKNKDLIERLARLPADILVEKMETLSHGVKTITLDIEKIRNSFPFDMEEKIMNPEWIAEQVNEIQISTQKHEQYKTALDLELNALIIDNGTTQSSFN